MQPPITNAARRRRAGRPPLRRGCPLPLWRTRSPATMTAADVAELAGVVAATAILHERRWPAAVAGDPAAAAAVAIDRLHRQGPEGPLVDVVMGNLVVLAHRDGDTTARVVLAHALRSLSRLRPARADLPRIAADWAGRPRSGGRGRRS